MTQQQRQENTVALTPLSKLSDEQLLTAIANGNDGALGALYDRYAARLFGIATRLLSDRRDAEDLIHDLFLEIWHNAASFDARRGNVQQWLQLRLRSRAIDRWRKHIKTREHALAPAEEPSTSAVPDQTLAQIQATQLLASLSTTQRTVLQLRYFEGLSCEEIAARCQIPVGTVKSRASAALTRLRTMSVAS